MVYFLLFLFLLAVVGGVAKAMTKEPEQTPVTIIRGKRKVTLTRYTDEELRAAIADAVGEKSTQHSGFSHAEIEWAHKLARPEPYLIEYADRYGEVKQANVALFSESGKHPNGHEYVGAYHNGHFKTYRKDRVLKLEPTAKG